MTTRMRTGTGSLLFSITLAFAAFAWISPARAQIQPAATSTTEAAPIPEAQIPADITDAINSPDRPAADKALDAGRRPDQILAFYGIKPGMKVADIFAGGGYMTELYRANRRTERHRLLAEHAVPRQVQENRRCMERTAQGAGAEERRQGQQTVRRARPAAGAARIARRRHHPSQLPRHGRLQTAIATTSTRRCSRRSSPAGFTGSSITARKPGTGDTQTTTLHRIDEDFLIKDVEKAGFKLSRSVERAAAS